MGSRAGGHSQESAGGGTGGDGCWEAGLWLEIWGREKVRNVAKGQSIKTAVLLKGLGLTL